MAWEENLQLVTLEAGADLSSSKHLIATMSTTDRRIAVGDSDDDPIIGVIVDDEANAAGHPVAVCTGGICPVKRGAGTITAGIEVTVGTGGKAVPLNYADGDEVNVLGMVVSTGGATADGELIMVLVKPYKFIAGAAV